MLKSLGEGQTSKVYLGRSIKHPKEKVAIKIMKEDYLNKDSKSL